MRNVMTRLKESLTNNIGIKVTAVVVAAIVWLAIVNVNDPEKTITIYNIPITMVNEEAITDLGMVYNVESKDSINLTIAGKRSVVGDLSADDFVATASLAELSKVNAIPIEVTARNSSVARKITIVKQSLNTVKVSVENIETQTFDIEVEYKGSTANGYVVGNATLSKKTVNIKAPESVLDKVERVVAVCNLESTSTDLEKKCSIVLYDKRGNTIKSKKITMSVKNVVVNVDILKEKEVPLNITVNGKPADGYMVLETTFSSETVKLVGYEDELDAIESIDINNEISISGRKNDLNSEVDLKKYLPAGVWINGDSTVSVNINIIKLKTKDFNIDSKDIKIENIDKDLSAEISSKSIKVTLRGQNSVIDKINTDDIKISIDLKGKGKGTSKVKATVELPDDVELMENITIKVKLK